jgi:hypothetical protein
MKNIRRDQKGSVLLMFVITLPFLIIIAASYMDLAVSSFQVARKDQYATHSQLVADAGLDYGIHQLNADLAWVGTVGQVQLHNDGKVKTTYEVTITDVDSDTKIITATGRVYTPVTSATPVSKTKLAIDMRPVTSGNFSVVTGVGGLYLSNTAKILGGNVFVNGEIQMSNSAQIGLSTSPVTLQVAHQNCPVPPNATYPRLCASGENGQPITLINNAKIYGSVSANNQTNGAGMSNPGLVASSGVTPQGLPPHDRAAQKAAVATTITAAAASCSSGVRTWAANTKITGDVIVSNSCKVTVNGNVWITGKLTLQNSSQLIVADSLGTTRPDIMVDGSKVDLTNSSLMKSNSSSTGFRIITYWSRASCSPDCADVTGTDLANSRNDVTIELSNNSEGPHTMFYSRWSRVLVGNGGQIGALIGQTVELKNSSTVTFNTSAGVVTTYWVVDGYRRIFD